MAIITSFRWTPHMTKIAVACVLLWTLGCPASAAPPLPPTILTDGLVANPPELSASLSAEFVDSTGTKRRVRTSGQSTVIRGVAPFLVSFDASESRAHAAFADQNSIDDQEAYAFLMVGYRLNYGDQLGGTWRYPQGTSYSRAEDIGPPVFSRVYRNIGTHIARLKVQDTLGNESQVAITIIVEPPENTVHIPVEAGQWPSFANNTRYTLQAGGDYRGFGALEISGRHNISIEKTGSGSDPRIGTFSPEARSKWSAGAEFEFRSAHIRLVDIDIARFTESQRGFDYVGVIGGRMRSFSWGAQDVFWHEGSREARSNARFSHGFFLQGTEANNLDGNGYVLFGVFNGLYAQDTRFVASIPAQGGQGSWSMLRLYGTNFVFRNNLWISEYFSSVNHTTMSLLAVSGRTETRWRDDNMVGPLDSPNRSDKYGLVQEKSILQNNQFFSEGSYLTSGVASTGGNPSGDMLVRLRLVGWEDNVWYPEDQISNGPSATRGELSGQHLFWRNNRKNLGNGDFIDAVTSPPNLSVGDTTTFHGPYLIETENSRPRPTPF